MADYFRFRWRTRITSVAHAHYFRFWWRMRRTLLPAVHIPSTNDKRTGTCVHAIAMCFFKPQHTKSGLWNVEEGKAQITVKNIARYITATKSTWLPEWQELHLTIGVPSLIPVTATVFDILAGKITPHQEVDSKEVPAAATIIFPLHACQLHTIVWMPPLSLPSSPKKKRKEKRKKEVKS